MILPLAARCSCRCSATSTAPVFVGSQFPHPHLAIPLVGVLERAGNNTWFFIIHMLVQNPIGVMLAALLSSPKLRFRLLPHGDLRPDDPVLRHRRLRLEADPVAAVGRGAASADLVG